jgi:hypothetical protein
MLDDAVEHPSVDDQVAASRRRTPVLATARATDNHRQAEVGCSPQQRCGLESRVRLSNEASPPTRDRVGVAGDDQAGARIRKFGRDGLGGGPRRARSHQN